MRDVGRDEIINLACPVVGKSGFRFAVLEDLEMLLARAAGAPPRTMQPILILGALYRMAKAISIAASGKSAPR